MGTPRMADVVRHRLTTASRSLGVTDPSTQVGGLIDRTFDRPADDEEYAHNTLTPGAAPFEPSFSEAEPGVVRFVLEPLGPGQSPVARRDEATREARRLIGGCFGSGPLRWFDRVTEEFRGTGPSCLDYGAWFGSSWDNDGLTGAKVYYELAPGHGAHLPRECSSIVSLVGRHLPEVDPLFVTVSAKPDHGIARVTFLPRGLLRVKDLESLMTELGMGQRLPGLMHAVGLALGGRFELPRGAALLGIARGSRGAELKLEIALGMIDDLPANFLDLIIMGLRERPRQLQAFADWMRAFTPEQAEWPGNFSVLSIRVTPRTAARMSLYLRPVEMEVVRLNGHQMATA